MKIQKLISVLCAAAMVVSSMSAFAAEPEAELSKYAGKTMKVLVSADDQEEDKLIEVAIPEGATVAEQMDMVDRAAYAAAHETQDGIQPLDSLEGSGMFFGPIGVSTGWQPIMTIEDLDRYYSEVSITFYNVKTSGGATQLELRLSNEDVGATFALQYIALRNSADAYVTYVTGRNYNGGWVTFDRHDSFLATARTNAGSVQCNARVVGY